MKRDGTVCFIVNNRKVLLAEILLPNGETVWNGIGGYVDEGETKEEAVIREFIEETHIEVRELKLIYEATVDIGFDLHIFTTSSWSGVILPKEDSIKRFSWFDISKIPYNKMHIGNDLWLPSILKKYDS